MSQGRILFKLTGSIACFKAAALISKLVQTGFEVQTVATTSALKFVGEATLEGLTGRKLLTDTFERGDLMGHINWAKWADLSIVYPATANTINKLANGVADDLLGSLYLAHDFKKPYLIAPAMNTKMLEHPATQESLLKLKKYGVEILDTANGQLACGDVGAGRLAEPETAFAQIQKHFAINRLEKSFDSETAPKGRSLKILVTSGGTREAIDGVRSITNSSSGETGVAIAEYLCEVGHEVTLVRAEQSKLPKLPMEVKKFSDFESLNSVLKAELSAESYDCVIHLAAVSDYSVESIEINGQTHKPSPKLKLPSTDSVKLQLKPNFKILDRLKDYSRNKAIKIVAFKLTKNSDSAAISNKIESILNSSESSFVVHNDLAAISGTQHLAQVFDRKGQTIATVNSKIELAQTLEKIIREVDL